MLGERERGLAMFALKKTETFQLAVFVACLWSHGLLFNVSLPGMTRRAPWIFRKASGLQLILIWIGLLLLVFMFLSTWKDFFFSSSLNANITFETLGEETNTRPWLVDKCWAFFHMFVLNWAPTKAFSAQMIAFWNICKLFSLSNLLSFFWT